MSAKVIFFDFRLPENLYLLNKKGDSVPFLSAVTGYSAAFVAKMIQREMCRESRVLKKQSSK